MNMAPFGWLVASRGWLGYRFPRWLVFSSAEQAVY